MRYTFFTLVIVCTFFINSCKTAADITSDGTDSGGDISFTKQSGLPQTGGNVIGIALLSDNSMAAIIDDKLYTVSASGAVPQLINSDIHTQLALAPDGSIYAVVYDLAKSTYSMRRYDMPTGLFVSLSFPGSQPNVAVTFRFAKNGEVYISYQDGRNINGNMYYSTDKGATWINLPHEYGQIDVGFTPSGDLVGVASSPSNATFITSSDHGAHWVTLSTHPVNGLGRNIFVRSNGDIFTYDVEGNIFHVSRDAGKTFTKIDWTLEKPYMRQLLESGGAMYVIGGQSNVKTVNEYAGILRSDDGGTTWKSMFLCATPTQMSMNGNAIALGSTRGIFFTADGKEWTQTGKDAVSVLFDITDDKDGNILLTADATLYRRSGGKWTVLASPSGVGKIFRTLSGDLLCSGGTSIIRSSDNGLSWQFSTRELKAFYQWDVNIMGFTENTSGDIYAAVAEYNPNIADYSSGELLRSMDGGVTFTSWYSQNNFTSIFAVGSDMIGAHQLFIGKHTTDALFSGDKGKTWTAYTGKYPQCVNSQNNFLSYRSVPDKIGYYFVNYSTKAEQELTTNIVQDGHTFVTSLKFASDDRLYAIIQSVVGSGYSIYISDKALK